MKITLWTTALSRSHDDLVITTHANREEARKVVERALTDEDIVHIGDRDTPLAQASVEELMNAWEHHFDHPCRIESHDVELLDQFIDRLVEVLHDRLQQASPIIR